MGRILIKNENVGKSDSSSDVSILRTILISVKVIYDLKPGILVYF